MAGKGKPKSGGRKMGTLNKSTQDIKALASDYGPKAIAELARLATDATNEQTRVSACKELLDRGYGKAVQSVAATIERVDKPVSDMELARRAAFILTRAEMQLEEENNTEKGH